MSKAKKLMIECKQYCLNCSITYQRVNDFSVEIYRKYDPQKEPPLFYSDGHLSMKEAAKQGHKWLKGYIKSYNS